MLSHLKSKPKNFTMPCDEAKPAAAEETQRSNLVAQEDDKEATQMTCDVLCSLSNATSTNPGGSAKSESPVSHDGFPTEGPKRKSNKTCPKQLQLPMFLSSKSVIVGLRSSYRIPCSPFLCPSLGRNREPYIE